MGSSPWRRAGRGRRRRIEHRAPARRRSTGSTLLSEREMLRLGADIERHGHIPPEKLEQTASVVARIVRDGTRGRRRGDRDPDHEPGAAGRERRGAPADGRGRVGLPRADPHRGRGGSPRVPRCARGRAACRPATVAVVDVGGGSAQVVVGSRRAGPRWARSIDLGSQRLTSRLLAADPPGAAAIGAARAEVERYLDGFDTADATYDPRGRGQRPGAQTDRRRPPRRGGARRRARAPGRHAHRGARAPLRHRRGARADARRRRGDPLGAATRPRHAAEGRARRPAGRGAADARGRARRSGLTPRSYELAQPSRRLGRFLLERPDVALEERDQLHRRGGDDRRSPAARRDQRNLAEHVAGAQSAELRAVGADLRGAALDRVEGVAEVPLGGERLALGGFDLVGGSRDGLTVGVGEVGEERNGCEADASMRRTKPPRPRTG